MINFDPACISNHKLSKVWGEIIHPFPYFNGATVKVWEWISNFIPQSSPWQIWLPKHMGKRGWFGIMPGSSYHCTSHSFRLIDPGLITLLPESTRQNCNVDQTLQDFSTHNKRSTVKRECGTKQLFEYVTSLWCQLFELRCVYQDTGALPWQHGSWDQRGAHLGPTGPRWAPCWPCELCSLG